MKADPHGVLTGTHFIDGDHACCEGALAAGARFAAGYPITDGQRQGLERTVTSQGSPATSSLSRDLLAGHKTEVEPVLGDLVARASAAGLSVPYLNAATLALRVHNQSLLTAASA